MIKKKQGGFVAITLAFFIAGILLALVASFSIESANFFDQAMKKVYREMNYYYAYDCLDQAILRLSHDYFYTIASPVEIPEFHCTILYISILGNKRTIETRGDYQKAYVYRQAIVNLENHKLEVIKIE
jgi:hypothetical protein